MKERKVISTVRGQRAIDGAGVHLVRVLGPNDIAEFDPFLMLDSFDSTNPRDYIKGFPMHPHRGIETITYLIEGEIDHEDSLGNKGVIMGGQSQWMTAGSGILHQEMPKAAPRMLGLQVWLNLKRSEKMVHPTYFDIKQDMIGVKEEDFGTVRVIAGEYKDVLGVKPPHWDATMYDVTLSAGQEATIETKPQDNAFIFLILGDAQIDGQNYPEKTAVLFGIGDVIRLRSQGGCRFLYFSGKKMEEPVAWGGPVVMNTRDELEEAFSELEQGTFIKHEKVGAR